eukprot:CAMPEP_0115372320 /NCGR_PEP_ID=MMETSP0271-20121206/839_1 /TAXON_ID=71861 /ORGANISM="Scrippsiella trochoidea, Strain CCMP3099" /LENGTH=99 /DNA_ID=CAMNT_0002795255 /DNA_START=1244 /DNA_END=1543 /DNA_ORIENTATION=+
MGSSPATAGARQLFSRSSSKPTSTAACPSAPDLAQQRRRGGPPLVTPRCGAPRSNTNITAAAGSPPTSCSEEEGEDMFKAVTGFAAMPMLASSPADPTP